MYVTELPIVNVPEAFCVLVKQLPPMAVTPLPIRMSPVKPLSFQPFNAPPTLSGIIQSPVQFVKPRNALLPIDVTVFGIFSSVRRVFDLKQLPGIEVIPLPIWIVVNLKPSKQDEGIVVTLSGMTRSPPNRQP
tara:strand:+ start:341 stop:739 length:399 start_codon:yes stop_codon:yes gene_type:complete